MSRRKWIVVVAAVVGALSLGWVAIAQASWRTVGKAWGQGGGPWVESNTEARNANRVRFVVRSSNPNVRIKGAWSVGCESANGYWSRRGRYRSTAPITKSLRVGIATPNKCDVHSWAWHTSFKSSRLSLTIQKR